MAQRVCTDFAHPQKYLLDKNLVYVNAFVTEQNFSFELKYFIFLLFSFYFARSRAIALTLPPKLPALNSRWATSGKFANAKRQQEQRNENERKKKENPNTFQRENSIELGPRNDAESVRLATALGGPATWQVARDSNRSSTLYSRTTRQTVGAYFLTTSALISSAHLEAKHVARDPVKQCKILQSQQVFISAIPCKGSTVWGN